jgi:non-reducing end alpha-L-arabinofuranosidase
MEAINWGNGHGGAFHPGAPDADDPEDVPGPHVMADLENGVWAGDNATLNPTNKDVHATFVTAMLKGGPAGSNHWTIKGGDATHAGALHTLFDGARPPNYSPMHKQGAIVLGIGGDNSDFGVGTFYEGCMTASATSDATDAAVHANIAAAGYGK